jgi:hypothetical protein
MRTSAVAAAAAAVACIFIGCFLVDEDGVDVAAAAAEFVAPGARVEVDANDDLGGACACEDDAAGGAVALECASSCACALGECAIFVFFGTRVESSSSSSDSSRLRVALSFDRFAFELIVGCDTDDTVTIRDVDHRCDVRRDGMGGDGCEGIDVESRPTIPVTDPVIDVRRHALMRDVHPIERWRGD